MTSKRTLALLLVFALGLWSCGGKDGAGDTRTGDSQPSKETDTNNPDAKAPEVQEPGKVNEAGNNVGQTPAVQEAPELPPLVFDPPLPTTPLATVNGTPVPAGELLEFVLQQNFTAGVNSLVLAKIVDHELIKEKIAVTEEAIDDEIRTLLEQSSPGRTVKEIEKSGKISMKHLRRQARTQRGWKEIYWKRQNIAEDQRHAQTNQMLLQFWIRQTMQNYDIRVRGNNPGPLPGLVAQINDKADGNQMYVTAGESLDFLIGLAKLGGLLEGREQMIDRTLVANELKAAGVTVTEKEINQWAQQQRAKHPPPFTWEQICKIKGTSTEREMERTRRIRAFQRVVGHEPSEEEVLDFIEKNKSFFLGKTKKVSHILVRTTDAETDLPIPGKEAEAEEKIKVMHQKLVEGLDFGWMAETYSDDSITARGKGRLAQPIKQWGGPLDVEFRKAAWKLENVGDMSDPIKSRFGWHVIKLDEVNEPARRDVDWKDPRYWDWVVDEYMTQKADAWLAELKSKADITREPNQAVYDLKSKTYWSPPERPKKDPPQKPDDGE